MYRILSKVFLDFPRGIYQIKYLKYFQKICEICSIFAKVKIIFALIHSTISTDLHLNEHKHQHVSGKYSYFRSLITVLIKFKESRMKFNLINAPRDFI